MKATIRWTLVLFQLSLILIKYLFPESMSWTTVFLPVLSPFIITGILCGLLGTIIFYFVVLG